ncbi:MAG: hypothetical protein IPK50_16855 [Fibrobacterota bacterium]|nr:MAG: hypothetical protein IPK50_16855 [Fibrobacterota bacterium]
MKEDPVDMRETLLASRHVALGARMVPFSGWNMPVQYKGIVEEHRAVREQAGLFDVSHMGRFVFSGPAALAHLESLTSNRVSALAIGQFQYSSLPNEQGGLIDDILVGRIDTDIYHVVVNAGNLARDRQELTASLPAGVAFSDESLTHGIIALQGRPRRRSSRPWRRTWTIPSGRIAAPAPPCPEDAPWFPAPATPARTDSSSTRAWKTWWKSGTRCWPREPPMAWCRPDWARAIRCAWKQAIRCTDTNCLKLPLPSKPASAGSAT